MSMMTFSGFTSFPGRYKEFVSGTRSDLSVETTVVIALGPRPRHQLRTFVFLDPKLLDILNTLLKFVLRLLKLCK